MYVYDCNAILTTATKNISDKEMIRDFTSLTEDLKTRGINPGSDYIAHIYPKKDTIIVEPLAHRINC